jgi:hypothetical protein
MIRMVAANKEEATFCLRVVLGLGESQRPGRVVVVSASWRNSVDLLAEFARGDRTVTDGVFSFRLDCCEVSAVALALAADYPADVRVIATEFMGEETVAGLVM